MHLAEILGIYSQYLVHHEHPPIQQGLPLVNRNGSFSRDRRTRAVRRRDARPDRRLRAAARGTSEADRDVAGTYDGRWRVAVLPATNKTQTKPGWRLNCNDMETEFTVTVADGTMSVSTSPGRRHEAYVSADGRFTLAMPLEDKATEKAGSSRPLSLGDTTLFLSGDLDADQPAGTYMVGIKEFGNAGCRTKASFTRA